jgi:hypothetical protein
MENLISPTSIEAEYERLGHTLGWRFLTCPEGNIGTATVALVTENPGGASFQAPRSGASKSATASQEDVPGHGREARQGFKRILCAFPFSRMEQTIQQISIDSFWHQPLAQNFRTNKCSDCYRLWK